VKFGHVVFKTYDRTYIHTYIQTDRQTDTHSDTLIAILRSPLSESLFV